MFRLKIAEVNIKHTHRQQKDRKKTEAQQALQQQANDEMDGIADVETKSVKSGNSLDKSPNGKSSGVEQKDEQHAFPADSYNLDGSRFGGWVP